MIVTEKKETSTPSTLEITLKLLATNQSCEKQQFFKHHQTPALKGWLGGYFTQFKKFSHCLQTIPH